LTSQSNLSSEKGEAGPEHVKTDEARGRSGDPPPLSTTSSSNGLGGGGGGLSNTGSNSHHHKEDVGGRLGLATASNDAGGVSAKDRTDTDGDVSMAID
jgi:hypothetical protein